MKAALCPYLSYLCDFFVFLSYFSYGYLHQKTFTRIVCHWKLKGNALSLCSKRYWTQISLGWPNPQKTSMWQTYVALLLGGMLFNSGIFPWDLFVWTLFYTFCIIGKHVFIEEIWTHCQKVRVGDIPTLIAYNDESKLIKSRTRMHSKTF